MRKHSLNVWHIIFLKLTHYTLLEKEMDEVKENFTLVSFEKRVFNLF